MRIFSIKICGKLYVLPPLNPTALEVLKGEFGVDIATFSEHSPENQFALFVGGLLAFSAGISLEEAVNLLIRHMGEVGAKGMDKLVTEINEYIQFYSKILETERLQEWRKQVVAQAAARLQRDRLRELGGGV